MKPEIYITRVIPSGAIEMLKKVAQVKIWTDDTPMPYDTLLAEVKNADGLLCLLTDKIDARLIDGAHRLKVISNFAVGFDNIDVAYATGKGIAVGNTPGVLTETTADLAFTLLMSAARRVPEADRYVRAKKWQVAWGPMMMLGQDVFGATLGIVGIGRIGEALARRARGFGMKVLYIDNNRRKGVERELGAEYVTTLKELLSRADFISLHVPLTQETRKLIGPAEFSMMKPTAILVNTSRGQVVDQKALYEALKSRKIWAAAIDVAEVEPIAPDDPLLTLENIVITPHIASASISTRTRMAIMAAENVIAGIKGERLPNCVNPEVYERKVN